MLLSLPWTVQMLTVRSWICQDSDRSSNGCAASLRNRTGAPSTLARRRGPTGP